MLYPLLSHILFLLYYCTSGTLRKKCRTVAGVMDVYRLPAFKGIAFILHYGSVISDSFYPGRTISCCL